MFPFKNFSSGMVIPPGICDRNNRDSGYSDRDEVLSVGDFRFQEKCEARIQNMKDQGTTILFVSHSIEQVKKICNKVVWLDHGVLKMFGDAQEICSIYEKA